MADAVVEGDFAGLSQGADGRGRGVVHAVTWEETAEMERNVKQLVVGHPTAEGVYAISGVVDAWYDQVGEFYPHASVAHGKNGIKHGLQRASAHPTIDIVAEGFQVDIGGIDIGQQVAKRLLTDIARCDENVPQSLLMRQPCCVSHVFYPCERFGVGIGDAGAPLLNANINHLFGCEVDVSHLGRRGLRDVMVLTIQAAEIATCASDGETSRAGMEMIERLFLYRVNSDGTWPAIDLADEPAIHIAATAAQSRLSRENVAAMGTELAQRHSVIPHLIISAFVHNPTHSDSLKGSIFPLYYPTTAFTY